MSDEPKIPRLSQKKERQLAKAMKAAKKSLPLSVCHKRVRAEHVRTELAKLEKAKASE